MSDEAPWVGPMTPEMWIDEANGGIADMCAIAADYGVDEDALNMMEGFGGNVSTAVKTLAAEHDALRAYARALELKWWNEVNDRANGHPDTDNLVEELRTEHNVTELMDATH